MLARDALENLTWIIQIQRKETFFLKRFIGKNSNECIDVGSDSSATIWIKEAFPKHVTLFVDTKSMQLRLKAHKKIICDYKDESKILTKNKEIVISLDTSETEITIKFKNSSIKNIIKYDMSTLDDFPLWNTVLKDYGKLVKIAEGDFTWIYSNGRNVLKILQPLYTRQMEYITHFISAANELLHSPLEQILPVDDLIVDDEISLYVWVGSCIEGQTLYQLLAQKRKLPEEMFISVMESVADFIRDLHLQEKLYGALNPEDIMIDSKNNVIILGHYRSQLILSEMCEEVSIIRGFSPISQVNSEKKWDKSTDIFLLGSLLYFWMIKEIPFRYLDKKEYFGFFEQGKIPPFNEIPEKYEELIKKSLYEPFEDIQVFLDTLHKAEITSSKIFSIESKEQPSIKSKDDYFGNFVLKKKLGRGYLGIVYEALDNRTNKMLILKKLNGDYKYENTIVREASNAMILEHKNILKILEVGKCGDTPYIAYQYVSGKNLEEYAEEEKLSVREKFLLIKELAQALKYAHVKGIVHRNIKPSNIIIDKDKKIYLVDFGLSTDLYINKMFDKQLKRDFLYHSPSLLFGNLSPLHDVYSLGAVLYKFLTNSFCSDSLYLPLWSKRKLSRDAESICSRSLAKNSKHRYQNASVFAEDIDKFLNHEPVVAQGFYWYTDIIRRYAFFRYIVFAVVAFFALIVIFQNNSQSEITKISTQKITEIKNKIDFLSIKYEDIYLQDLQKLKQVSYGLTMENTYMEQKIKQEQVQKMQQRYKAHLQSEILPLFEQLYIYEKNDLDKEKWIETVENILLLCSKEERNVYLAYYEKLKGKQKKIQDIAINTDINSLYLFKYEENLLGKKQLFPFDLEKKRVLAQHIHQEKGLRVQSINMLTSAVEFLLQKEYFESQEKLIAAIKKASNYIDAYHLLCVSIYMSSVQKNISPAFRVWQKKAYLVIDNSLLSVKDKATVKQKFSHNYIKKMSKMYEFLKKKNNQVLCLTSVVDRVRRLKINDFIYQINGHSIQTSLQLLQKIQGKKFVQCHIIRGYQLQKEKIPTSIFRSYSFYAQTTIPFVHVWKNGFLKTKKLLLFKKENNRVKTKNVKLPHGDYLLSAAEEYYPFSIRKRIIDGSLTKPRLNMHSFILPADLKDKYVMILHKGKSKKLQNTHGYLLGQYEVTLKEWKIFLEDIYRDKGKKEAKKYIPIISKNKPLFYINKGEFTQIVGEGDWPIFGITYKHVQGYISWKNKNLNKEWAKLGFRWRLPTSKEWEYAAEGSDKRTYVWGNYGNVQFCNTGFTMKHLLQPQPVGSFPDDTSPFMIKDMAGNVKEYVYIPKNNTYGLKGNSWNESFLQPIKFTWNTHKTIQYESCGLRLCAGIDPFVKGRK